MRNHACWSHKVKALKREISIAKGQLYREDAEQRPILLRRIQRMEAIVPVFEKMEHFMLAVETKRQAKDARR